MSPPKLSAVERRYVLQQLAELNKYMWRCDKEDCDGLPHGKYFYPHARAQQLLDGHNTVAFIAGRGAGKTFSGAHRVAERMLATPKHGALIMADSLGKARSICIDGPSGLLAVFPPYAKAKFNGHKGTLRIANGSWATIFGSNNQSDAERPRGYESGTVWAEELGSWRYQRLAWDMLQMANRSTIGGIEPQTIITATPRPSPVIRMLYKWAEEGNCKLIRASMFDNAANLAPSFVDLMKRQYADSALGRQELYGELVEEVAGALWTQEVLDNHRVLEHPELARIVIAVDPSGGGSSEAGIVVVGASATGKIFVVEDASGHMSAEVWGRTVVELYHQYKADAVVGEVNFGGDMVQSTIRAIDRSVQFKPVSASRGKRLRAEPVRTLFDQGVVYMVGNFGLLESQLVSWVPPGQVEMDIDGIEVPVEASNYSPDRLDAMVHGISYLALQPAKSRTRMVVH